MLKKLQDDFREKLGTAQKEELNSQNAFEMVGTDLEGSIAIAKRDAEEKSKEKDRKTAKKASDTKQLHATEDTKAADEKSFKELSTTCEEMEYSFQEKNKL